MVTIKRTWTPLVFTSKGVFIFRKLFQIEAAEFAAFLKERKIMSENQLASPRLIRLDEVSKRVGLGKSTILAWEALTKFPKAVRLSPTLRLWLESDINQWIYEQHNAHTQTLQT